MNVVGHGQPGLAQGDHGGGWSCWPDDGRGSWGYDHGQEKVLATLTLLTTLILGCIMHYGRGAAGRGDRRANHGRASIPDMDHGCLPRAHGVANAGAITNH